MTLIRTILSATMWAAANGLNNLAGIVAPDLAPRFYPYEGGHVRD